MKRIPQDVIGSIAILKFPRTMWGLRKWFLARRFIRIHPHVTSVYEKVEGFKGRLRKPTLNHLVGVKTTKTVYKENGCMFFVDVAETYFSPRLASERKRVADTVLQLTKKKKQPQILVMFAGVAPYPIVIAKTLLQQGKKPLIISSELNKKATEYARENVAVNKLEGVVQVIGGDSKKLGSAHKRKYDITVMTRPQLSDTFLREAIEYTKKGGTIIYHGFGTKEEVLAELRRDGKRWIGAISMKPAGEIATGKHRWNAEFKVK